MDIKTFVNKINVNPNIALEIVKLGNPLNELELQFYWLSLGRSSRINFSSELDAIYDWLTEINEFTLDEDDDEDDDDYGDGDGDDYDW